MFEVAIFIVCFVVIKILFDAHHFREQQVYPPASMFEQRRIYLKTGIIFISGTHSEPSNEYKGPVESTKDLRNPEHHEFVKSLREEWHKTRTFDAVDEMLINSKRV